MTRSSGQAWDDGQTLVRWATVALDDDDGATSLHPAPLEPAPHRTQEEAEGTASAELVPLRLDPAWSQGLGTCSGAMRSLREPRDREARDGWEAQPRSRSATRPGMISRTPDLATVLASHQIPRPAAPRSPRSQRRV